MFSGQGRRVPTPHLVVDPRERPITDKLKDRNDPGTVVTVRVIPGAAHDRNYWPPGMSGSCQEGVCAALPRRRPRKIKALRKEI